MVEVNRVEGPDGGPPDSGVPDCMVAGLAVGGAITSLDGTVSTFSPVFPSGGYDEHGVFNVYVQGPSVDLGQMCPVEMSVVGTGFALRYAGGYPGGFGYTVVWGPLVPDLIADATVIVRAPRNSITHRLVGRTSSRCPSLTEVCPVTPFGVVLGTDGTGAYVIPDGGQVDAGVGLLNNSFSPFVDALGRPLATDIAVDSLGRGWATTADSICQANFASGVVRSCVPINALGPWSGASGTPDGGIVVSGRGIYVVDPVSGDVIRTLVPDGARVVVSDVAVRGDSMAYVSLELQGEVLRVESLSSGAELLVAPLGNWGVGGMAWTDDGIVQTSHRVTIDPFDGGILGDSPLYGVWRGAASRPIP